MRHASATTMLIVLGAALLFACSDDTSDTVTVKKDDTVDFNQYTTFAVSDGSDLPAEVAAQIPAATRTNLNYLNRLAAKELLAKGLQEVTRDQNPGLVVFSLAWTSDQQAVGYTCVPGSYWYSYWYYTYDPCAWIQPWTAEYTQGSVVVALNDPARQAVVFGGLITGVADQSSSSQQQMERIMDDMARLFDSYPVTVGPPAKR